MECVVRPADWDADRELIRAVRDAVFVHEQLVPPELEWDNQEETAQHFLVVCDGAAVGTGRISESGKIGRMAILKSARGTGLGQQLLNFICEHARSRGFRSVYLHSQCHAEGFYQGAGFVPEGDIFHEAGIPHIRMVRTFG